MKKFKTGVGAKLEKDYFVLSSQFEIVTAQMLKSYFLRLEEKKEEESKPEEIKVEVVPDLFEQIDDYISSKREKLVLPQQQFTKM